jgi:uncharacterized membrane protein
MQSVIESLKAWQPHPFVDHFTVALILIGILTDLIGSIFSARLWIRYMALTLMIGGAIGAAGSNVTGGWEAGRVWDSVSGAGKTYLQTHAWWGHRLPWVFGALAVWRLGLQFLGFIAASRPIYLMAAVISGVAIIYQGHLGSVMVYDYGIGMASTTGGQTMTPSPLSLPAVPSPEMTSTPGPPTSLLSPTPSVAPTVAPSPAIPTPTMPEPTTSNSSTPPATPVPSPATPVPSPAASMGGGGALINPPPGESPSPAAGEGKNL